MLYFGVVFLSVVVVLYSSRQIFISSLRFDLANLFASNFRADQKVAKH